MDGNAFRTKYHDELIATAKRIARPGVGILAADESTGMYKVRASAAPKPWSNLQRDLGLMHVTLTRVPCCKHVLLCMYSCIYTCVIHAILYKHTGTIGKRVRSAPLGSMFDPL